MTDHDTTPDEAELLLPWYGTGRLSAEEAARVEAWLEAHPEARDRLGLVREEIDTTVAANEAAPTPPAGAIDRLMDRVEAAPRRRARRAAAGLIGRIGAWLETLSPGMRGGLVAAGLVLVIAQAAVIGLIAGREPATYRAATGPGAAVAEAEILVSFAPEATAGEITALLGELGARIVDGPKPGGIYALALAEGRDPQATVDRLAARDIVAFAALGSAP